MAWVEASTALQKDRLRAVFFLKIALDMRDLGPVLAHPHGEEIESSEGPAPPPRQGITVVASAARVEFGTSGKESDGNCSTSPNDPGGRRFSPQSIGDILIR